MGRVAGRAHGLERTPPPGNLLGCRQASVQTANHAGHAGIRSAAMRDSAHQQVRRLPSGKCRLNVIPMPRGAERRSLQSVAAKSGAAMVPLPFGFQLTGEKSEGQTVGVLDLTNA